MDKGFMHTFEVGNFHLNHLSLFNQELVMYKRNQQIQKNSGGHKNQCADTQGCISCMLITVIS